MFINEKKGQSILIFLTISQLLISLSSTAYVQHRHERSTQRTVTFEIEPKPLNHVNGDHHHYYFKVGTDKVNLSCTVNKPHMKFKMLLTKEQHVPGISNNSKAKMELLRSGDSSVNPDLEDFTRFKTFDSEEDETNLYRISFQISNLQLSDNGKYTCSYANIPKEINLVVYEQLDEQNVILSIEDHQKNTIEYHDEKVSLDLGKPYQFQCLISEIYPKPNILFNINETPISNHMDQVKHHERTILKDKFYVVKSNSTVDLTVTHQNHHQNFACVVTPGVPGVSPIIKKVSMNVKGIHLIESSCVDKVRKNEDGSVLVICKYFANPEPSVRWTVTQTVDEPTEDTENVDGVVESRKSVKTLENGNEYAIITEPDPDTGIFKATLEAKNESDLKDLTIHIEGATRLERAFTFVPSDHKTEEETGKSEVTSGMISSLKLKSIHSILFSTTLTAFIFKYKIL